MNSLITPLCVSTEMNSLTNSDTEITSLIAANGSNQITYDVYDDNAKLIVEESFKINTLLK